MSNGFDFSKGEAERSLSITYMDLISLRGACKWTSAAVVSTCKHVLEFYYRVSEGMSGSLMHFTWPCAGVKCSTEVTRIESALRLEEVVQVESPRKRKESERQQLNPNPNPGQQTEARAGQDT